jgi:hypothetical protein
VGRLQILIILDSAVKQDQKSAGTQKHKVFEFVGGLNPGTVRVNTDNSKTDVILNGDFE